MILSVVRPYGEECETNFCRVSILFYQGLCWQFIPHILIVHGKETSVYYITFNVIISFYIGAKVAASERLHGNYSQMQVFIDDSFSGTFHQLIYKGNQCPYSPVIGTEAQRGEKT